MNDRDERFPPGWGMDESPKRVVDPYYTPTPPLLEEDEDLSSSQETTMHDLVTLPDSVRQRLLEARELAQRQLDVSRQIAPLQAASERSDAEVLLREAGRALAHSSPELVALLFGMQAGKRQLSITVEEYTTDSTCEDQIRFGIRIGRNESTTTSSKTTTKTYRFD